MRRRCHDLVCTPSSPTGSHSKLRVQPSWRRAQDIRTVDCLESLHSTLVDARRENVVGRNKRYPPELLCAECLQRWFKDKLLLQKMILEGAVPLMPSGLESVPKQALDQHCCLPNCGTRMSLTVDTALMLQRRAELLAKGLGIVTRYGFAYSSSQVIEIGSFRKRSV